MEQTDSFRFFSYSKAAQEHLCAHDIPQWQQQDRRCWLAYFMPAPFIKWVLSEARASRQSNPQTARQCFLPCHSCSSQTTHSSSMCIISLLRLICPLTNQEFWPLLCLPVYSDILTCQSYYGKPQNKKWNNSPSIRNYVLCKQKLLQFDWGQTSHQQPQSTMETIRNQTVI